MELGCHAQDDIKETATKAKAAVLLLSPKFVTSEYTLEELSIFLKQKTFLVPIFGVVGPNDCSDILQAMHSNRQQPEYVLGDCFPAFTSNYMCEHLSEDGLLDGGNKHMQTGLDCQQQ